MNRRRDISTDRRNGRIALAAVYAAFALAVIAQFSILGANAQIFGDFHAFYCGGAAVLHGQNPYNGDAIGPCESQRFGSGLAHIRSGGVVPVPLPGYVFTLFSAFALLPYVPAAVLWFALCAICIILAIRWMAQLCGLAHWTIVAIIGVAYTIAVLFLGQLAPVALAALCRAALDIRSQRYGRASGALCIAAILPHVLLPAFIAVFLFERRMRLPLVAGGALLVLVDVAMGGPMRAIGYFRSVLPAHAYSEIGYIAQFGLTWAIHALGASDRLAVLSGTVSYVLACGAGIAMCARLRDRFNDRAWLVVLPPAFAVIGGPYVHFSELTLAMPALLLLRAVASGVPRTIAGIALLLLCVPWQWLIGEPQLVLPLGLVATAAVSSYFFGSFNALRVTCAVALFDAILFAAALHFGPQVERSTVHAGSAMLAQGSWAAFVRAQGVSGGAVWWLAKAPTWLGLLILAAGSAYAGAVENRETVRIIDGMPLRP